jgi:hypothetical protein
MLQQILVLHLSMLLILRLFNDAITTVEVTYRRMKWGYGH